MSYQIKTRDEHLQSPGPKRILALDGGGLRGIVSLMFLKDIEQLLRARHGGDPNFRLAHYFDLIAGTSTGSIIAAGLAIGMQVDELIEQYEELGKDVFTRSWFRNGLFRARYDADRLSDYLRNTFGERTLGDVSLQTGLLIVTKRLDSGSPWPFSNNPKGKYYDAAEGSVANQSLPLWQVVRASTAAPTYFEPEALAVATAAGKTIHGEFIDGGLSPHNNPSLQALMFANLKGFKLHWPLGKDQLQLTSIGTGRGASAQDRAKLPVKTGVSSLMSLRDDCAALVETMMQWMSAGNKPRVIDREIGNLGEDLLMDRALFSYQRYQVDLRADAVHKVNPDVDAKQLAELPDLDEPDNIALLKELAQAASKAQVRAEHFGASFDLPKRSTEPQAGLKRYQKRQEQIVTAIPLQLYASATKQSGQTLFAYHKWGGEQRAKSEDWLVQNGDEVYTIDKTSFANTYQQIAPGRYRKHIAVWAEQTTKAGAIQTNEGSTNYQAGDYLVYNQPDRKDGYAVEKARFEEMYQEVG